MRLMVDGMNVIGTRPDDWWKDRDRAMRWLVDLLERLAAAEGDDITVMFERPPRPPIRSTVIEIRSAPRPRADAADLEIIRLLRDDRDARNVRVVTSDRALADQANAIGATVESAGSFRQRLEMLL